VHINGKGGAIFAHIHTPKVDAASRFDRLCQLRRAVVHRRVHVGVGMQANEFLAAVTMHLPGSRISLGDIAVEVGNAVLLALLTISRPVGRAAHPAEATAE
jgi:hypothetical protein